MLELVDLPLVDSVSVGVHTVDVNDVLVVDLVVLLDVLVVTRAVVDQSGGVQRDILDVEGRRVVHVRVLQQVVARNGDL